MNFNKNTEENYLFFVLPVLKGKKEGNGLPIAKQSVFRHSYIVEEKSLLRNEFLHRTLTGIIALPFIGTKISTV